MIKDKTCSRCGHKYPSRFASEKQTLCFLCDSIEKQGSSGLKYPNPLLIIANQNSSMVKDFISLRNHYRSLGQWEVADKIRDILSLHKITIKDIKIHGKL